MKWLIFLLIVALLIGPVTALDSLGRFPQGEPVRIVQTCSDATYVNISSISYPNSSVAVSGIQMTSAGSGEFYYYFNFTDVSGRYDVRGISDGCENTFATYFDITFNGQPLPEGSVIVLFSIVFLIIVFFMLYELIMVIGHFASLDLDAVDLAKSMGTYFTLLALYALSQFYLGNPFIDSWMLILLSVGGLTHVIIPIIGFLISITIGSLKKKKVEFGTQRIYRRNKLGKV